ncbi:MAG: hypothetical protein FJ245_14420 [Nitrospira sp.]|nr:hypothetical protein [Nitrospira sp.]
MGRTLATFTQLVRQELEAWRRYRRALRQEDQQALDALFAAARRHSAAGAYVARETPVEVMFMSMLLEHQKELDVLGRRVANLETSLPARQSDEPPDRMAP